MGTRREEHRVGVDYLNALTALLQRARNAHPTKGLYEAAEMLWWWAEAPRPTDDLGQLFWFDDSDRPEGAAILTDWFDYVTLDPIVMPDADPEWVAQIVARGLSHASESGYEAVQLEVDRADEVMREVLAGHGFTIEEDGLVESWLVADGRPAVSQLREDYRLSSRHDTMQHPHHMIQRHHCDIEQRLLQTPLYRSDLDLLVLDSDDNCAAYGLFWYDPETATGVVEPMRTENDHQRRGLARHILTVGINLLAEVGAERIKIVFEPDNPASSRLYRSVGFEPVKQTDTFSGRADASSSSSVSRRHAPLWCGG